MKSRLIGTGEYIVIEEEMTWPNPACERIEDIEWRMRHAHETITKAELMYISSFVAAYRDLICFKTQKDRNAVCAAIKATYL